MDTQKTMLIVDDMVVNRLLLSSIFQQSYRILQAGDGQQALDILHREGEGIAVVLLDIIMPNVDGFEVLTAMRVDSALHNIPVIVVSAMDGKETELRVLELGAADMIVPPFEPVIIIRRVQNVVGRWELMRTQERNRMLEQRRKEDERYRIMREISKTIVSETNHKTHERFYSENITQHFAGEYINHRGIISIWKENGVLHPEDEEKLRKFFDDVHAAKGQGVVATLLMQFKTKRGDWEWYRLEATVLKDENGEEGRTLVAMNNVDADMKNQQELQEKADVIALMVETMNAALKISNLGAAGTLVYFNENLCNLLDYTREEFMALSGGALVSMIYPPDLQTAVRDSNACLTHGEKYRCEYRLQKKDGSLVWVQDSGRMFVDKDGVTRLNSVLTDITPLKEAMAALKFQAEYDQLTGIYNKSTFYKKTQALLANYPSIQYLVICWDIGRFKVINDLFGTQKGDELLCAIGAGMRQVIANMGTYGRLEADNFAMCVPHNWIHPDELANITYAKLKQFPIDFEIVPSFGIYAVDDIAVPVDLMCDRAKLAQRTIKGHYMNRYAFYDDSMRDAMLQEQQIVNEMNDALQSGQFELYFQPQYNHATQRIVGTEALVRWVHPTKGILAPGAFISVLEKNGFITKLDEYVWERVCQLLRNWIDQGNTPVPTSVNISRVDIYNRNLCAVLGELLQKYQLPVSLLKLEITESAYVENPEQLIEVVKQLRAHGFVVEMDDFGSGYSSLNMLKDVPVDVLKLDLRFLSGEDTTGRGGNILNSIVRMAKWLKLPVIAEGVETKEQADFLKSIGCNFMQGYYYSRPLPIAEFEALLLQSQVGEAIDNSRLRLIRDISDINEFWKPKAQTNMFFDVLIDGAGVFEYYNGGIEALRVNNKCYDILGVKYGALFDQADNLLDFLHAEDRPVFQAMLDRIILGEQEEECEARWLLTPDAPQPVWLRVRGRLIACNLERYVFYVTIENITVKKEGQEQLAKTNLRLQTLVNGLPGGVFVYRLSDKIEVLYANDSLFALLGYTREELCADLCNIGAPQVHPDDLAGLRDAVCKAGDQGGALRYTFRSIKKDGSSGWLTVRGRQVDTQYNCPIFCAILLDVASEKQMEIARQGLLEAQNQTLRKQKFEEERYRFIVEQMGATVFEWNLETSEFYHSESYNQFEMSRKNTQELLDNRAEVDTVYPDDLPALFDFYKQTKSGAPNAEAILRLKKIDGNFVWCRMTGQFICNKDGKPLRTIGTISVIDDEIRAKRELEQTSNLLSNILANLPVGVGIYELGETIRTRFTSHQVYDMFGYTQEEYEAHVKQDASCIVDLDRTVLVQGIEKALQAQHSSDQLLRGHKKDGSEIWVRTRGTATFDENGAPICYATLADVTQNIQTERRLHWQEERYRILAEHTNSITFDYDPAADVMNYTVKLPGQEITETTVDQYLEYLPESKVIHPDYKRIYGEAIRQASQSPTRNSLDYIADYGMGFAWYRAVYASVADDAGDVDRVVGRVDDIHQEKLREIELQRAIADQREKAERDAVTGLLNRATVQEFIGHALRHVPGMHAFLLFDIDNFKTVNDTYGHPEGDRLLASIARTVTACIRTQDIAGRIGGDEFVVFLSRLRRSQHALQKAAEICRAIQRLKVELDWSLPVSVSAGVAMAPRHGNTFEQLFKCADTALYQAKVAGKNRWMLYSDAE